MAGPYIFPGLGTVFAYSADNTTYHTINQVVTIDGPTPEMSMVETTNLSSSVKTNRPTLGDPGTCSVEIQWDPGDAGHIALYTAFLAKTNYYWKETLATAAQETTVTTAIFQGFIKAFPISGLEAEGNVTIKFDIQAITMPIIAST